MDGRTDTESVIIRFISYCAIPATLISNEYCSKTINKHFKNTIGEYPKTYKPIILLIKEKVIKFVNVIVIFTLIMHIYSIFIVNNFYILVAQLFVIKECSLVYRYVKRKYAGISRFQG